MKKAPQLSDDEFLDLVDANDNVIGKMLRSEAYHQGLSNFRVINAFIVNSKGELWIPRRPAGKRVAPLGLDFSVGGHVESGESYESTFKRETREELNINTDKVQTRILGYLTPHQDGVSAFMKVFEIRSNEVPNYNPDDFTEYYWLSPQALLKRIEDGDRSKDDLPVLLRRFYSNQ